MNLQLHAGLTIVGAVIVVSACLVGCNSSRQQTPPPDEHHFKKVVLAEGLPRPVMLDFDARNRIYIAESVGNIMILDQSSGQFKKAGFLPTYDGNEFGLIGLKLDPHFEQNGFIYLHYFRKDSVRMECISRFTMQDDSLIISSEKNYLHIRHDNTCCHTAGGMAFDTHDNLYIATGDNTDAFFTHYALTDDQPGHLFDDALRSAGNTNDYRGKILRIHPEPDGSYSIPDGNLFPKGTDSAKPEIYIMGVRNPYRITIDPETDYLYWGEVGPDADKDSTRGPMGYDEFNQAREAGNFGWPLFIGNNQAYNHVYFEDHERVGEKFDTAHPVNFSHNNTGMKDLPPAHPAFIWYPYDSSRIFPSFGAGGRTAIGGPIYHYDASLNSTVKFPAYFDHCWFIADWMRNWIKAVHLDEHSRRGSIDDLMPHTVFKKPIFMQFGKDGALYVLEYGSSWGENPDTKLARIEYIPGNLAPVASLRLDKVYGKAPLTVNCSADSSVDYDKDQLQFSWLGAQGDTLGKGIHAAITFNKPGRYPVKLIVQDEHGATDSRDTVISVGNALPDVEVQMANHSFYWDTIRYVVTVSDAEDGTIGNGIRPADVLVTLQRLPPGGSFSGEGADVHSRGEVLMNESDCKACHQISSRSVGPSFEEVAAKYNGQLQEIPRLAAKILAGGTGVWGSASMSAHPQLNIDQAATIVKYIYSLAQKKIPPEKLPLQGAIAINNKDTTRQQDHYVLTAGYTDRGADPIGPLTQYSSVVLRNATVPAADFDEIYDGKVSRGSFNGLNNSHAVIRNIDLTAIRQVLLHASGSGSIEIRIDSVNGKLAGTGYFNGKPGWQDLTASLLPVRGVHNVYILFVNKQYRFIGISLQWVQFGHD